MSQNPVVTIEMENGSVIKAELYPEIAPNTVNNFLSLVNNGYYDGLTFHRVIYGFMIQGWVAPVTQLKANLLLTALKITSSTQRAYFLWLVQ